MMRAIDMTGKRYGRLVAIRMLPKRGSRRQVMWEFRCDCGRRHRTQGGLVRYGHTTSCGCFRKERVEEGLNRIHGQSKTNPLYEVWAQMRQRCLNPNHKNYDRYGGRGISVCQAWLDSFERFVEDMGTRPEGWTLERLDNDGPYSADNCCWAPQSSQCLNRHVTYKCLTVHGETLPLIEWAGWMKVPAHLIRNRLRIGWSEQDAVLRPARYLKAKRHNGIS